jgi:3',5'-nucleoside bisphosphate phosphatase
VHAAGGLASLAHPGVTKRDDRIPEFAAAGLDALEARHSDHDAPCEQRYRDLARELGLLLTGGSDFHGEGGHRVPRLGMVSMPDAEYAAFRRAWTDPRARA